MSEEHVSDERLNQSEDGLVNDPSGEAGDAGAHDRAERHEEQHAEEGRPRDEQASRSRQAREGKERPEDGPSDTQSREQPPVRLSRQREMERQRQQAEGKETGPQHMSDREFEDMLRSKQREVRERRKRLAEAGDPDAAEDLWEDWLDEKRELKDERRLGMEQADRERNMQRAHQVREDLDSMDLFEHVRWAADDIVDQALRADVDPGWLAAQFAAYEEARRERAEQGKQRARQARTEAYTEAVDGGPKPSSNDPDFRSMWRNLM